MDQVLQIDLLLAHKTTRLFLELILRKSAISTS
jgi:hypothetical protein